jgi:GTPase
VQLLKKPEKELIMFQHIERTSAVGFLGKHGEAQGFSLPPEIEEGNIEYKLKLTGITPDRLEHLTTQMKWRLAEGNGEAIYEIGIADNGTMIGLSSSELSLSVTALESMASQLKATCTIVRKQVVTQADNSERFVVEVLVRKRVEEMHFLDVRVAILGATDGGKSTLLSVLTYSELDNGQGKARSRSFNHKHEVTSGKTSSLREEVIGFDSSGQCLNYATCGVSTAQDIVERATKIVTLVDFPGLLKYLPTTISGISGYPPNYAMLVVNPTNVTDATREHLGILVVLRVPFFIVVTKIDVTPGHKIKDALGSLVAAFNFPGRRCIPKIMRNEHDIVQFLPQLVVGDIVPIFLVSSVSGANLPLLTAFLNLIPQCGDQTLASSPADSENVIFQIHDIFDVPGTGTVVGGHLLEGRISLDPSSDVNASSKLMLGPFQDGCFHPVIVKGIHRFFRSVTSVDAGRCATLAICDQAGSLTPSGTLSSASLRRGMVLLSSETSRKSVAFWEFKAELHVLHHTSAFCSSQIAIIFCGSIRQAARATWLEKTTMKTGECARVKFRFLNSAEWIKAGMILLAREGRVGQMKCVGKILNVYAESIPDLMHPNLPVSPAHIENQA